VWNLASRSETYDSGGGGRIGIISRCIPVVHAYLIRSIPGQENNKTRRGLSDDALGVFTNCRPHSGLGRLVGSR